MPVLYSVQEMGSLFFFFASWWGFLLEAIAIIHFIRRRPDFYWLFVIIFLGWIGAVIYILVEMVPDASLPREAFEVFPRRRRNRELQTEILGKPAAGNYEELGDLALEEGNYA